MCKNVQKHLDDQLIYAIIQAKLVDVRIFISEFQSFNFYILL